MRIDHMNIGTWMTKYGHQSHSKSCQSKELTYYRVTVFWPLEVSITVKVSPTGRPLSRHEVEGRGWWILPNCIEKHWKVPWSHVSFIMGLLPQFSASPRLTLNFPKISLNIGKYLICVISALSPVSRIRSFTLFILSILFTPFNGTLTSFDIKPSIHSHLPWWINLIQDIATKVESRESVKADVLSEEMGQISQFLIGISPVHWWINLETSNDISRIP